MLEAILPIFLNVDLNMGPYSNSSIGGQVTLYFNVENGRNENTYRLHIEKEVYQGIKVIRRRTQGEFRPETEKCRKMGLFSRAGEDDRGPRRSDASGGSIAKQHINAYY